MRSRLVSPDSHEWTAALEAAAHDVYHFPGYARLCARLEGGDARALIATDGRFTLLFPLIVRDVPRDLCDGVPQRDATAPYGYPGPLISRRPLDATDADADAFLRRALDACVGVLREERIVSAFCRLHPLLPIDTEPLRQFGTLVMSGETVAIDLSLSEQALWRQMRSNHRRDVTRAKSRGETADVDPEWAGLSGFVDAYRETMTRVGAGADYRFSDEYFATLRQALGGHIHLWTARSDHDVMAGALFTECGGIVQYHLGGTLDRFLPGNPIKLLFHRASEWFKARGNRWLHLGGGVGGAQDSLMHFKRGFSSVTVPFYTWRLVLDMSRYDELSGHAGADVGDVHRPSFFPAYRQARAPRAGLPA